jgi:hypothetical protein
LEGPCSVFVRWRKLAIAQLEAVAEGKAEEAARLTVELAEAVLALPVFPAALAVREGGPLAIARGVGLAERVLEATSADARTEPSARKRSG